MVYIQNIIGAVVNHQKTERRRIGHQFHEGPVPFKDIFCLFSLCQVLVGPGYTDRFAIGIPADVSAGKYRNIVSQFVPETKFCLVIIPVAFQGILQYVMGKTNIIRMGHFPPEVAVGRNFIVLITKLLPPFV